MNIIERLMTMKLGNNSGNGLLRIETDHDNGGVSFVLLTDSIYYRGSFISQVERSSAALLLSMYTMVPGLRETAFQEFT